MTNTNKGAKDYFIAMENKQRAAYRRAVWLERRLFDAPTEKEYSEISAELEAQERELRTLGLIVAQARVAYMAAL